MRRSHDGRRPDAGAGCHGDAGVAGAGRCGDGEMLSDKALKDTRHEEGREDGDEER